MTNQVPRICIFGAGSIGTYVGGRLQAAGAPVSFVGRERIAADLRTYGLTLTDWQGAHSHLPAAALDYRTDAAAAAAADLVIVTVKSAATEDAGASLRAVLKPSALVISLQNGVRNAEILSAALPQHSVLAGMIPFNVVQRGNGVFHAGTEGHLTVEKHPLLDRLHHHFVEAGIPLEQRADMPEVMWAKLLLNLNNPINALSDLPLKAQLSQRDYRRCLALLQREALSLLKAAGIRPAQVLPVPVGLVPWVLGLPDWIFTRVAQQMLAVDPLARSSMWEDLQAGRKTEIDWINGEVVHLAQSLGRTAPRNRCIVELIRQAENGKRRPWSGSELLRTLREFEHGSGASRAR